MRERDVSEPELAGARGSFSPEYILRNIREMERNTGKHVIAVNPVAVCGRDHVISAYMHALRAFSENTAAANDFSAEFFRYLTGERQVSVAIDRGGVRNGDAVIVSEIPVEEVIDKLGLKRDDSLIECSPETKKYLGIDDIEIKGEEMALELVAMVAIL